MVVDKQEQDCERKRAYKRLDDAQETITYLKSNYRTHLGCYKCPVCEGRGGMETTFYTDITYSPCAFEQCRSCKGEGVLWG